MISKAFAGVTLALACAPAASAQSASPDFSSALAICRAWVIDQSATREDLGRDYKAKGWTVLENAIYAHGAVQVSIGGTAPSRSCQLSAQQEDNPWSVAPFVEQADKWVAVVMPKVTQQQGGQVTLFGASAAGYYWTDGAVQIRRVALPAKQIRPNPDFLLIVQR